MADRLLTCLTDQNNGTMNMMSGHTDSGKFAIALAIPIAHFDNY